MYLISIADKNDWLQIGGYLLLAALIIYFIIQIIVGYKKGGKK